MQSIYLENEKNLSTVLNEFNENITVKGIILLLADKNSIEKKEFDIIINTFSKPVIGGLFPELIVKGEKKDTGILIIPLLFDIKTISIDVSKGAESFDLQLSKTIEPNEQKFRNLLIFANSLSERKNEFIHRLFNYLGTSVKYLGGGAGSLSFKPMPCIIDNSGIHQEKAIIAFLDTKLSIGVAHGWQAVSKPLKITEAKKNIVKSIEWEPAFEVYSKFIKENFGKTITPDNFFDIAKSFPLGMIKLDSEMVIRDPFMTQDQALYIVDEIPEGEYVSIMNGDIDSLLKGAKTAKNISDEYYQDNDDAFEFCIDCISRVLYMQNDFDKELKEIKSENELNGIMSIGEIANTGEAFLEIYNKTIVVTKWKNKK